MPKLSDRWIDRRKRAATLAAVCLALAAFVAQTSAQRAIQSPGPFSENFDIRTDKSAASDAYLNRVGSRTPPPAVVALMRARAAGLARLRANLPVEVTENAQLGTPEIVDARIGRGFLTAPATDRVAAMRAFLSTYADAY